MSFLLIHASDNVAVCLKGAVAGTTVTVGGRRIVLKNDVPTKHKATLLPIAAGEKVIMYGVTVAKATVDIPAGSLLTVSNVTNATDPVNASSSEVEVRTLTAQPVLAEAPIFRGYHRADGQVGTANYWLVIPLVFCENHNVNRLRTLMLEELGYAPPSRSRIVAELVDRYRSGARLDELLALDVRLVPAAPPKEKVFPNVDGIKFLTHEGGCGGTRQDAEMLCKLLAGYLRNPNVAGATVLSLGCQNAEVPTFLREVGSSSKPLYVIEHQGIGTNEKLLAEAVKKTFAGLVQANQTSRTDAGLKHLCLGLECGGSDGFSGISANPVLGYVSDRIVAAGGRALLAEFPELAGVENELIRRCRHRHDAEKFVDLMKRYGRLAESVGSGFAHNPSPGNLRDGLLTDAMKSAGAAKKGGNSPVEAVLDYGEYATAPGLNLLCTPGNDVESTTGLAGSGANLIVFTTGLGTPTGNPVAPVVKVSSNTPLSERMADTIDFDAGPVLSGEESIAERGEKLLGLLLAVASGQPTKATLNGQDDFIPWRRGVSL